MAKIYQSFELKKGPDTFRVDVLDDGQVKTSTDKISMPNHSTAENFFATMQRLLGGTVNLFRKTPIKAERTQHIAHERSK